MEGQRLIRSLKLKNLLSYGSEGVEIELQPLNILVGPNGSGKSNLIEVIRLLQSAPIDLTQPIINGGGINEWLWKGEEPSKFSMPEALLESVISDPAFSNMGFDSEDPFADVTYTHSLRFTAQNKRLYIRQETILASVESDTPSIMYTYSPFSATISTLNSEIDKETRTKTYLWKETDVDMSKILKDQSILSQRNDPQLYPYLSDIRRVYQNLRFYTDSTFGRGSIPRLPQNADADATFLAEDYSNLSLVVAEMQLNVKAFRRLLDNLKIFYERVENIVPRVSYGTVQLYFQERGLQQLVPATRLSDGTLRYLCLLTILCHPTPPPLICIEEPELGIHPDILPTLANLLLEASQRTQLIVTTHSDIIISKFSDTPETIIVCDRDDKGTSLQHLDRENLEIWLRDYSLGEAWLRGAFGGTRW